MNNNRGFSRRDGREIFAPLPWALGDSLGGTGAKYSRPYPGHGAVLWAGRARNIRAPTLGGRDGREYSRPYPGHGGFSRRDGREIFAPLP